MSKSQDFSWTRWQPPYWWRKPRGLASHFVAGLRFPFKAWSFGLRPPPRAGPTVQPEVAGPTRRRPQHGVPRTDSGQAGLALTQEPCKANKHRQSQSPTQGPASLEDGHRLCSHLETPFIWLNKGRFRFTLAAWAHLLTDDYHLEHRMAACPFLRAPLGMRVSAILRVLAAVRGWGWGGGETGARVYRKAQVTACVSMFVVV